MACGEDVDLQEMAQRVWEALDHMAETSPDQYKKFIEKQMREGREVMAAPEPVFCLRCTLGGAKSRYLYVNVCKWSRVPKPQTDKDPIPVKGGLVRHLLHKESRRKTQDLLYDIAFNPHVLEECGRQAELQEMLESLCLDYVQNETKLTIPHRKDCKKLECTHKGALGDIQSSIDEQWREFMTPESKLDIGDSLLRQIRDLKANGNTNNNKKETLPQLKLFPDKAKGIKTGHQEKRKKPESREESTSILDSSSLKPLPPQSKAKQLIQELDVSSKERGVTGNGRVCVPEHSVTLVEEGGGGEREVRVKVTLPGVGGVKEVELEVSESDLELSVADRYHLCLQFPEGVSEESTRATYNIKQSLLTVAIPCQQQTTQPHTHSGLI